MKTVLLSGYYGFGNLGDEIILKNIAMIFRDLGYHVCATSSHPSYSSSIHRGIEFVNRYDNREVTEIIRSADLVALGGGGLFQDHYPLCPENLYIMPNYIVDTFLSVPLSAKIYNKPVAFLFQGVGPLFSDDSFRYTRFAYSLSDYISVRDNDSKELLKEMGFSNVFLSSDPSLLYPLKELGKKSRSKRIGISLRKWIHESYVQRAIHSLASLIKKTGRDYEFIFIPFFGDDILVYQQLCESLGSLREVRLVHSQSLDEVESIIGSLDMMIGMRLHSIILAIKYAIPFISIPYSLKVYSFLKDCGLESLNVDIYLADSMENLFDHNLNHYEEIVTTIKRGKDIQITRLREEIERMKDNYLHRSSKVNPTIEVKGDKSYLRRYLLELREELEWNRRKYEEQKRHYTQEVESREGQIQELLKRLEEQERHYTQEVARRDGEINGLSSQLVQVVAEKDSLWVQFNQTQNALNNIYGSHFWKVASFYYRVRDNTPIIKDVFKALKIFRREGIKGFFQKIHKKVKYNLSQAPLSLSPVVKKDQEGEGITSVSESEPISYPNRYDVIFFSIINWDFRFQRPQQIASRFAKKGHRVFYLSVDLKRQASYTWRQIDEKIYEITLPFKENVPIYQANLSEALEIISSALENLFKDFRIKESIAFVEMPLWYPAVKWVRDQYGAKIIFDCLDQFSGFGNVKGEVELMEEMLLKSSDFCITTSNRLFERMKDRCSHIALVRNATDFEHFQHLPPNDLLKGIKRPILGYYGAIAEWFDTDMVEHIATQRPDWSIVLIGHTFGSDVGRLRKYKNVHLLGEKPYAELPNYLFWFDVCLIPFKLNELTLSTNPVKFYEFISSGKPVVASKLPELVPYSDFLYLSEGKEEFVKQIETALKENDEALMKRRIELARENDWESRFCQIEEVIQSVFPKVSVLMVTFNNLDYTKLCLQSLYEKTAYPNLEVIVVDNGSTDGTQEYLLTLQKGHRNLRIILNEKNFGFAKANNMGIKASEGQYLIFLNNDTVVTRGWISGLIKYFKDPSVGMVGPVTNLIGNEAKITVDYRDITEMDAFAEGYTAQHRGISFEIPVLAFYCVAIPRKVIDQIGWLDEQFSVGLFEDDDYAFRLKRAGFKILCAEDVFIHHFGGATFSKLPPKEYQKIFDENKRRYEQKWGIPWTPHRYRNGVM